MTPLDIRVALLKAGISQASIAREYGCTRASIGNVIDRRMVSRPLQELIARRLGRTVSEVFPERNRRAKRAPALAAG